MTLSMAQLFVLGEIKGLLSPTLFADKVRESSCIPQLTEKLITTKPCPTKDTVVGQGLLYYLTAVNKERNKSTFAMISNIARLTNALHLTNWVAYIWGIDERVID